LTWLPLHVGGVYAETCVPRCLETSPHTYTNSASTRTATLLWASLAPVLVARGQGWRTTVRQSHRTTELLYASLQFHQELPNTRHVTRYHTFVPAAFEYLQDRRSQGILVPPRSVHNISIGLRAGSLPTGDGRDRAMTTAVAVATPVSHGQVAAPEANTGVMHTSWWYDDALNSHGQDGTSKLDEDVFMLAGVEPMSWLQALSPWTPRNIGKHCQRVQRPPAIALSLSLTLAHSLSLSVFLPRSLSPSVSLSIYLYHRRSIYLFPSV